MPFEYTPLKKSPTTNQQHRITLPTLRMSAVCGCIGYASHFLVSLDSVVDNLLPPAMVYLLSMYGTHKEADRIWKLVVSLRVYGLAVGSVLAVIISTYCGRRKPLIFAMLLELIGALMCGFIRYSYTGIYIALVGRFINGLGSGIAQVIGIAMTAEVPAVRHRGTVLATHTIWACIGELFGLFISMDFALGNERYWPVALALPAALIPICIICLWSSAESPRYLVAKNQLEEAKKALLYYQINDDYDETMADMLSENRLQSNQLKVDPTLLGPLKQQMKRFKDSLFFRPLLVAMFTQNFVHLDDWLWILYSTQVFIKSGLRVVPAQTASLLMTIPQAFISITIGIYFDNFSRRTLLVVPTIASIFCGLLAAARIRSGRNIWVPLMSSQWCLPVLATVDLCLAAVASESAYTVTTELFLQTDRVVGTAIVTFVQNIFGGILSSVQLTIINEYGAEYVLIAYAIINVFYVIGVLRILPETARKTFQEISKSFSTDFNGFGLMAASKFKINSLSLCSMAKKLKVWLKMSKQSIVFVFLQCILIIYILITGYRLLASKYIWSMPLKL